MNRRIIVISSIALNFLLLGALIWKIKMPTNLAPNSVGVSSHKMAFTNSSRAPAVRLDWRSVEYLSRIAFDRNEAQREEEAAFWFSEKRVQVLPKKGGA